MNTLKKLKCWLGWLVVKHFWFYVIILIFAGISLVYACRSFLDPDSFMGELGIEWKITWVGLSFLVAASYFIGAASGLGGDNFRVDILRAMWFKEENPDYGSKIDELVVLTRETQDSSQMLEWMDSYTRLLSLREKLAELKDTIEKVKDTEDKIKETENEIRELELKIK